ncbi:MAG: hypothetical protein WCJ26_15455 [bacterium]
MLKQVLKTPFTTGSLKLNKDVIWPELALKLQYSIMLSYKQASFKPSGETLIILGCGAATLLSGTLLVLRTAVMFNPALVI